MMGCLFHGLSFLFCGDIVNKLLPHGNSRCLYRMAFDVFMSALDSTSWEMEKRWRER